MAEQKIEFRKTRDFGENLNDTFQFLRLNFKPLFNSFFAICGLFMLVLAVFKGIYQSSFGIAFWQEAFRVRYAGSNNLGEIYNFQNFMLLFLMLLTFVSMQVALGAYVKYYVENDGRKPAIDEVWAIFRKYFLRIFVYNFYCGFGVLLGSLFCLIPGIYLSVVFVPIAMIVMIEDANFMAAYHRCFELIKENFWTSFLIYFVVYFIYYISWAIIGGLISVVFSFSSYVTTQDMEATTNMVKSFLQIFSFCFYILFLISVALNYFNLVEMKDGTGILNRLNNIGKHSKDVENLDEQY